jgi:site-specific recombinase XerD
VTIQRACVRVGSFLEGLRQRVRRNRFKALQAETFESCINDYLKRSRENLTALTGTLRRFFLYCASHKYTNLFVKLPLLSTYLGHTSLAGTEVYLHATAELLESVGKRFHSHFAIPAHNGKEGYGKD